MATLALEPPILGKFCVQLKYLALIIFSDAAEMEDSLKTESAFDCCGKITGVDFF